LAAFSFTLRSDSSQTISIWLRSGDCGGQVIWCSTQSLFLGQIALGSLSCWKTNDSPTEPKPDGMAYRCRMLWKPCCLSVPWIWNKTQYHQQSTTTP
jgi:hypothetical protein